MPTKFALSLLLCIATANAGSWFASGPTITTSALPAATAGTSYSFQMSATGGKPPYRWSASSALPSGLSITQSGVLTGAPSLSGSFFVTIVVTDSRNKSSSKAFTLTVNPAPAPTLTISPGLPPPGVVGQPYRWQIPVTGGTPPYTCAPDPTNNLADFGLALSPDCTVSGTPTKPGTVTF